ncbi:MAG: hypothetical protein JWL59_21 [Chthoniobacteraceae bacterium]|nr:hypothetical protein [Chthoniobacteraceae bacterium]
MSSEIPLATDRLLSRLSSHDRERLGEALRRLLAYGSILGFETGQADLYHWGYQNRDWLEEIAALLDLKLFWEHELRLVQAIPQRGDFLLRLKLDATLVLLTLWYEFDTAIRDRGETPPVALTAEQLNDSLRSKFEPLKRHLPSPTRLREILIQAQRKNLVRFTPDADFPRSLIEILSTLKRVIPFQDLEDWSRHVERQLASSNAGTTAETEPEEEALI